MKWFDRQDWLWKRYRIRFFIADKFCTWLNTPAWWLARKFHDIYDEMWYGAYCDYKKYFGEKPVPIKKLIKGYPRSSTGKKRR